MQSKCEICAKPIKGFAFRCGVCSFQMHPCCAMLSSEMKVPSMHPHELRMLGAATSSSVVDQPSNLVVCGECKRRRSGRVYRCTVCEYHVHAVCAKSLKTASVTTATREPRNPACWGPPQDSLPRWSSSSWEASSRASEKGLAKPSSRTSTARPPPHPFIIVNYLCLLLNSLQIYIYI